MKYCIHLGAFFLFFFWVLPLSAMAYFDANRWLAPALFPQSIPWLDVADLPRLEAASLERLGPELRQAVFARLHTDGWESKDCSITERILRSADFFRLDVDGDGLEDILYSGSFQCAEGGLSILWYGSEKGYQVRDDSISSAFTLRIEPGHTQQGLVSPPRFIHFQNGCCGDFLDTYILQPEKIEATVWNGLNLPKVVLPVQSQLLPENRIRVSGPVELRDSPEEENLYDRNRSDALGFVLIGNILAIFPEESSHCEGSVLGYDAKREWAFAVLDGCKTVFEIAPGMRVGWIPLSAVQSAR